MHKQVWIKVNSPVDEGIAELVCLFNQIDRLLTWIAVWGMMDGGTCISGMATGEN